LAHQAHSTCGIDSPASKAAPLPSQFQALCPFYISVLSGWGLTMGYYYYWKKKKKVLHWGLVGYYYYFTCVMGHWHRLPRETVGIPACRYSRWDWIKPWETWFGGRCSCSWKEWWNWVGFKDSFSPSHSTVLWLPSLLWYSEKWERIQRTGENSQIKWCLAITKNHVKWK